MANRSSSRPEARVGKVVPFTSKKQDFFGLMAGEFKVVGDIEFPPVSLEEWEVMRK